MLGIQNYMSFITAILIFQLTPGPGTLTILTATARHGRKAGMGAVLGTLMGDFVYMTAAVVGLAAVMRTHPLWFQGLQWIGVGYLCWMGWQLCRSSHVNVRGVSDEKKSASIYFRQAFVVGLSNPKVILFFVAFFPLFLRSDASSTTLIAMMAHVTILSLLYQCVLVFVGNICARKLSTMPLARTVATRVAGVALIGFGIKLACNQR